MQGVTQSDVVSTLQPTGVVALLAEADWPRDAPALDYEAFMDTINLPVLKMSSYSRAASMLPFTPGRSTSRGRSRFV